MAKKTSPVKGANKDSHKTAQTSGAKTRKISEKASINNTDQEKRTDTGKLTRQTSAPQKRQVSLKQQLAQREAELEVINSVQEGLAAHLAFNEIIHLVGNKLSEIFKVSTIQINIYNPDADLIHIPFCFEEGELHSHEPRTPFSLRRQILDTKQTLVINENFLQFVRQTGQETSQPPAGKFPLSIVGVPLVVNDQARGIIWLMDNDHEHTFTESIVRLVTTLANSMAIALENARLFDETQRLLEETKQRYSELAILNSVGESMAKTLDVKTVTKIVGDKVQTIFAAEGVTIRLYDPSTHLIQRAYDYDLGYQDLTDTSFPMGQGMTTRIIETGKPLLFGTVQEQNEAGGSRIPTQNAPTEEMQSYMGVPIIVGEKVIGTVAVHSYRQHAFHESHVRLLQTLASNMGVAIQNARLFEAEQERNAELALINSIQEGLASNLEIQAIYDLLGDKIREVFDAQVVTIATFDHERQLSVLNYGIEKGRRFFNEPYRLTAGHYHLIRRRAPILINQDWERRMRELGFTIEIAPGTETPKSHVIVPLVAEQTVKGSVSLQNVDRENAFSESDVRLLATLANSMSVALENARLFDETQRLLKETEQRAAELAIINSVQQGLASKLDYQGVIDLVGDKIREIFNAQAINIARYDAKTDLFSPLYLVERGVHHTFAPMQPGPLYRRVIDTHQSLRFNSLAEYNEIGAITVPGTGLTLSGIYVPLLQADELRGIIALENLDHENAFTESDLRLLTTLANSMSVALENAHLFDETQRLLQETEQRAAELQIINSVQEALASKLDVQAIYDLVGDKIRDIFRAQGTAIYLFDHQAGMQHTPYCYLNRRFVIESHPFSDIAKRMLESPQPGIYRNVEEYRALGGTILENSEEYKSGMFVPLMVGKEIRGMIGIASLEKENAYGYSDLRLLTTLASSMSIALENAHLFDEVTRRKEYFEALFQNNPVAVVTIDNNAVVTSWNPASEELFGYTREEAVGQNVDDLVAKTEEIHVEAVNYSRRGLDTSSDAFQAIVKRTRRDGSIVDVELSAVPIIVQGEKQGIYALYHDITELQRARQEAIAANEAKSSFLATMSHEIRTPMNAVIGMSGLLMDTELNKEQRDYAETIRNSGDALLAIINDILDFSKIEAGRMEVEYQPFDLRECVESALDLTAGRAIEKGLDIAYIMDDDVPAGIKSDVTRLRQILINLLSNAVKFTDRGEVVLSVKKGRSENELLFSVRDTGIGISQENMNRLFQSFSQADSSTTRKFGGTGLGLAISKRLVEMMGGSLHAESAGIGKGSQFTFTILAQPARVPERRAFREILVIQAMLQEKCVLIVDDNATNRRILSLQTSKWGMTPRETQTPAEALQWIDANEKFDLAILDLQMPEMDGLMLSREIRKRRDSHSLPIILLTSLGRREIGADGLNFAAYLTKPLKPSALYDALAGIFGRKVISPKVDSESASSPGRTTIDVDLGRRHPLRILLAEDNAVNQKLALRILEQMGYRADVASNGIEAVESIARQTYDVILMDVQMPDMDGLDATRHIRRLAGLPQPHIIAMTANALEGDREACLAAGMNDYVSKPIRVPELVQALMKAKRI